jgi:pilus assembly protein Flp/PilA
MRRLTISKLRRFLADDKGATAIEYALIASGVAGAIIAVVTSTGASVKDMYKTVSDSLQ